MIKATITNRGMVTIPAKFRKMLNLKDGDKVVFVCVDGELKVIPVLPVEELRKQSFGAREALESLAEDRRRERELEEGRGTGE